VDCKLELAEKSYMLDQEKMKTKLLRRRLEALLSNSNNPLKFIEDYTLYNIEGLANIDENISDSGSNSGFSLEPHLTGTISVENSISIAGTTVVVGGDFSPEESSPAEGEFNCSGVKF
jgi:hypothetical protein